MEKWLKVFIAICIIVLLHGLLYGISVFANDKNIYNNFENEYCSVLENYEYCIFFINSAVGPGYRGTAYLQSQEANPIMGPVPKQLYDLGSVYSRNGIDIDFENQAFQGQFNNGLQIFTNIIFLQEK